MLTSCSNGMTQTGGGLDLVMVAPTLARSDDVSACDEIGDDRLRGSFGDADLGGDVAATDVGVLGDAHEYVAVGRQKCPAEL